MHRIRYLVGLLTLALAIASAFWIVGLLRSMDERPGLPLQIEFRDARGLRAGADVRFRGVTVGTVRNVLVSGDGGKAVAHVLIEPTGAPHARVHSAFWIVTPRFTGLTGGATGLDTLVRDSYIAFHTPAEPASPLMPGSLLTGRERPPANAEPDVLEDIEHGDLLMTLLVPENHGLRAGAPVIFRGMQTGDVRSVQLAPAGTHVEMTLRIARRHRQTVTDKTQFWVARPQLTGALFSGFTVTDVSALLTPYIGYYGEPGQGVLVQDGYRAAAVALRPSGEPSAVPGEALRQKAAPARAEPVTTIVVRITYAAIERDTFSPDDPILRHGSGVLFRDGSGRALVVTARSLVDGAYTEKDVFGGDPDIEDERLTVMLPSGAVLRAGRIWVDPAGRDLAVLALDEAPPELVGTPANLLAFAGVADGGASAGAEVLVRAAGPDGQPLPSEPLAGGGSSAGGTNAAEATHGAAAVVGDQVIGIVGRDPKGRALVTALELVPGDLRPR
jgi:hypothetical protein